MVQRTQNLLDHSGIKPMSGLFLTCSSIADDLTLKAREDGPTGKSFQAEECVEATRIYFDGGVRHERDRKVKNKDGAGMDSTDC